MMSATSLIVLNALFITSLLCGFFWAKSTALKRGILLIVFAYIADALVFGGGSLRTLAETARDGGKTQDFINGLAAMNKLMIPVKARAALGVFGLLIIAWAGTGGGKPSGR